MTRCHEFVTLMLPFDLRLRRTPSATSTGSDATAPSTPKYGRKGRWWRLCLCLLALTLLLGCTRNLGASTRGWSPVVADEGAVYVATREGHVKALIDDGPEGVRLMWTFEGIDAGSEEKAGIGGAYNPPVVGPELVYVSAVDGFLYALDRSTGQLGGKGWRQPEGIGNELLPLVGSPALDLVRNVVVVGSEDGNLYAYNARTGKPLSGFPFTGASDKIWTTPVIRGNLVYFGSHDGNVYAVSLDDGAEKWRFATGGAVVAQPLVYRDTIIVGSFDKTLYAIQADTGLERWRVEGQNWFWAGAVAKSTTIFAPSMDGHVYAVGRSGNLLWKNHLDGGPIVSTPALVERGLVVATRDKGMQLLRAVPDDMGDDQVITSLLDPDADIKAPLFALPISEAAALGARPPSLAKSQEDSVFVGAEDGTVRRIRVTDTRVLWCFDTEEDAECK